MLLITQGRGWGGKKCRGQDEKGKITIKQKLVHLDHLVYCSFLATIWQTTQTPWLLLLLLFHPSKGILLFLVIIFQSLDATSNLTRRLSCCYCFCSCCCLEVFLLCCYRCSIHPSVVVDLPREFGRNEKRDWLTLGGDSKGSPPSIHNHLLGWGRWEGGAGDVEEALLHTQSSAGNPATVGTHLLHL